LGSESRITETARAWICLDSTRTIYAMAEYRVDLSALVSEREKHLKKEQDKKNPQHKKKSI